MDKKAFSALAAVAVAAAALVATRCGFGEPTAEGEIATAADDYLRALATDDTATACEQLAASAKSQFNRPCKTSFATSRAASAATGYPPRRTAASTSR
jgi:hypothetical protein